MTSAGLPSSATRRVPQLGDVVGKYRIERKLGKGGMGVVVAATHLQHGGQVALKFLVPGTEKHDEMAARMLREAQAAARIKSEHVARVLDFGTLDHGDPSS
jgi:serine/threonine-protein kinase